MDSGISIRGLRVLPLLVAALATGCLERQGRPVNPCTYSSFSRSVEVETVDKVDLLFMVDNSRSMIEEQTSLAAQFDRMVQILVEGDFNQDGDTDDPEDFQPVQDLNLGVVTSDMGTGGHTVTTCTRPDFGDDGLLRTLGNTATTDCNATYPPFLNFQPAMGGSTTAFAHDFQCIATVGTGGCAFEQQLEAPLKALMPTRAQPWTANGFVPLQFFGNTLGHGDVENAGFVRENSVLGIIILTDEDDCSWQESELVNQTTTVFPGPLDLRCWSYDRPPYNALHPVDRYVDGFLSLRTSPNLLVFAAITGIPQDLEPSSPDEPVDYDGILSDVRMVSMKDPDMMMRLKSSCHTVDPMTGEDRGEAYPPRRIVTVAQQLQARGAGVTVQSICQADFSDALQSIIRKIANALSQACIPRPLNTNADGSVDCEVVVTMPDGQDCTQLMGGSPKLDRNGDPLVTDGRSVCSMQQLVPTAQERTALRAATHTAAGEASEGWYYDNYTADGATNCGQRSDEFQRIAFTRQPGAGTTLRLECLQNILGGRGETHIGTFCDPSAAPSTQTTDPNHCLAGELPGSTNACNRSATAPENCLICDPIVRTCGVACVNDADCRDSGLVGFVCDSRPRSEVNPQNFSSDNTPYNFCVNPTCS